MTTIMDFSFPGQRTMCWKVWYLTPNIPKWLQNLWGRSNTTPLINKICKPCDGLYKGITPPPPSPNHFSQRERAFNSWSFWIHMDPCSFSFFHHPKIHCRTKQQNEQRQISSWVPHLLTLDQSKNKQYLGKKSFPILGKFPWDLYWENKTFKSVKRTILCERKTIKWA